MSLEIYRGELVAIMGRNASGKSTLIRHFNGLLKPSRGKVWVDGKGYETE
jgi:ABC-type proline/glycine betaine transport system ATPase subunit